MSDRIQNDRIQVEPQANGRFCLFDSWQFSKLCDFATRYDAQVVADGINAGDVDKWKAEEAHAAVVEELEAVQKERDDASAERDDALDKIEDMEVWFDGPDPGATMRRRLREFERERRQIQAIMPDLERDAELWRAHRAKLDKARDKRRNRKERDRLIASIQQHATKETHRENDMA